jgi:hypothetical protein
VIRSVRTSEETQEERQARRLIERELETELHWVTPSSVPTPDYRTQDGQVAVEVKLVTSEMHRELASVPLDECGLDSEVLTKRWTVMIDAPTLSTTLRPMPKFRRVDPELVNGLEADGFQVASAEARAEKWHADHPGPKRRAPRLKQLASDIEPHLKVLEEEGIFSNVGLYPYGQGQDFAKTISFIAQHTNGGRCYGREAQGSQAPGIDVLRSSDFVRTGRPNTIVGRIDLWLGSDLGSNLKSSLANEPAGTDRHAVLVFDPLTEPEHHAAVEQGASFCPTTDLALPDCLDVLWFVLGPVACRYSAASGWEALQAPNA